MDSRAGGVRPRGVRLHVPSLLRVAAVLVVGFGLATVLGPVATASVPGAVSSGTPAASNCSGPTLPTAYLGSLVVDGGPPPLPSVAGRTISLQYYVRENYTPSGGSSIVTCLAYRTSNVTDTLGGFALTAPVPGSGCTRASCTYYEGPLAPLEVLVLNATPAGYFVTTGVNGPAITASYVYGLATVALNPSGRATLSTDAPTPIRATAHAGNGAPSPANISYAWDLQGTGWNVTAGAGTPNLTIEAAPGAAPAMLELWANGSYNGTAEDAPPVSLSLDAVETAAEPGNVHPTSLDVGFPALFDIRGSGAIGYAYDARIVLGAGTASVTAPCVENGTDGPTEYVDCEISVTYNSTGVVQPSAVLSNGYSSAASEFPALTISPAPAVAISPSAVVAYVDASTLVTVTVATFTGTVPLGPACLSTGNGRELCDRGSGPSYPFQVEWGSPGSYDATASVADGAGANVSVPVPVTIYDPLVATFTSSGGLIPGDLGDSFNLTATVQGGALPLTYWWNISTGTLMRGTLDTDGTLFFPYTPQTLGWANVTLYVQDRLGTVFPVPFPALIVPGDPSQISMVRGGGSGTVMAGVPYPLEWEAVDTLDVVTPQFQSAELFEVTPQAAGPIRPIWVNDSAGPVASAGVGIFSVPASAWSLGVLDLNVTVGGDGSYGLALVGPLLEQVGPYGSPILQVTTNVDRLKLWDPQDVVEGARSSAALYRVTDLFDDNVTGGFLRVSEEFGTLTGAASFPILAGVNGSVAWVNYSALSSSAGTIAVTYEGIGPTILSVSIPGAPSPFPVTTVAGLGLLAACVVGVGVAVGRRRRRGTPSDGVAAATEAELERLSVGRAHVLARADPSVGRTLDELASGFDGRAPTPEEVTEWVASLVAEGTLRSELGPDGRSRFWLAAPPPPAPRVELDDRALEESLRRRQELDSEGPSLGPEGRAPPGSEP